MPRRSPGPIHSHWDPLTTLAAAYRIAPAPAGPPHAAPPLVPDTSRPPLLPAATPPWPVPDAAAGTAGPPVRRDASAGRSSAIPEHRNLPDRLPPAPGRYPPAPSGGQPYDRSRPLLR